MAVWQSQKDFPSETPRTKQTVAYLDIEIGRDRLFACFKEYFDREPDGEQVTLAVLRAVGRAEVEVLAKKKAKAKNTSPARMFNMVKQHIGLWVAVRLAAYYGPEAVTTYRQTPNGPSSTRQVPDLWKPELEWVTSYTPHRVHPSTLSAEKKATKS